jgi:hypothetical protein
MNLGKLLAAGKSIVNGNGAIEYRENKQVLLPKFVSPKNPFVHSSKPSSGAPAVSGKDGTATTPVKPQPMPPISAAPKSLAAWTSKLNPASVWRGPKVEAGKVTRPEVQAELSLDTVKVVHNDLSDADVEVVPIKSRATPTPSLTPAKKSWEILGERLMKATAL